LPEFQFQCYIRLIPGLCEAV